MIAEDLLAVFKTTQLLDAYDFYQHLMDYWAETMQDDCYIISVDGWGAKTARIMAHPGHSRHNWRLVAPPPFPVIGLGSCHTMARQ